MNEVEDRLCNQSLSLLAQVIRNLERLPHENLEAANIRSQLAEAKRLARAVHDSLADYREQTLISDIDTNDLTHAEKLELLKLLAKIRVR